MDDHANNRGAAGSILDQHDAVTKSIQRKADKNKKRSRRATLTLAGSTVSIPVSIVVSTNYYAFFFGKIVPSVLAAVTALITAWVQVERPHERWSLYRRYQRLLEADKLKFERGVSPFDTADRDGVLAENLAQRQLDLHDEWAGLLPRSAEVPGLATGKGG